MELGLWSSLWANCALGATFLALPGLPVAAAAAAAELDAQTDSDTITHDHETQTADVSSSESEISDAPDDSDREDATCDLGERGDNRSEVSGCSVSEVSSNSEAPDNKKASKRRKPYQRMRYSREEYRCTMCSYTCTTERAFLKHLRLHAAEDGRPGGDEGGNTSTPLRLSPRLSCPVCGKDKTGEDLLAKHMQRHRDNRYFCCDICSFKTVQLKKLIQHRRMHTGERPHLCPHCSYRAARRDNLRSHVRRVHKRDNLTCDTFNPRGMLLAPSSAVAAAVAAAEDSHSQPE